jgi:hypothetical protein
MTDYEKSHAVKKLFLLKEMRDEREVSILLPEIRTIIMQLMMQSREPHRTVT